MALALPIGMAAALIGTVEARTGPEELEPALRATRAWEALPREVGTAAEGTASKWRLAPQR